MLKDAAKKGKNKKNNEWKNFSTRMREKIEIAAPFICEGDSAIGGLRSAR